MILNIVEFAQKIVPKITSIENNQNGYWAGAVNKHGNLQNFVIWSWTTDTVNVIHINGSLNQSLHKFVKGTMDFVTTNKIKMSHVLMDGEYFKLLGVGGCKKCLSLPHFINASQTICTEFNVFEANGTMTMDNCYFGRIFK